MSDLRTILVQNTHPGMIRLDGDTASGRAYMHEIGCARQPQRAGRVTAKITAT
jgi:hypothetical protein